MALCRGGTRLYVADASAPAVIEFTIDDQDPQNFLKDPRVLQLYGTPFAMGCGLPADDADPSSTAERLYVATDEGVQVMAIDATFDGPDNSPPITAFLDIGPLQGGPQSLVRIWNQVKDDLTGDIANMGDSIVLADLMHDRLLVIPAGSESSGTWQIPVSGPVPYIAPSRFDNMLYLADSFSNVLSMVDKNTGVYASQFLVNDINSFGAADISTARLGKSAEALLVPLPPPPGEGVPVCRGFDRLIVRLASDEGSLTAWQDEWLRDGYSQQSGSRAEIDSHGCFDEMLPAPRFNSVLLVRYGEDGEVWSMGLAADADKPEGLMGKDLGLQLEIPFTGSERLVRLSPSEELLAVLQGSSADQPGVKFIWLEGQNESSSIPLDAYSALFTYDLAVTLDSAGQPVIYLALPSLGEVVALKAGAEPYIVSTAGSPMRLFFSPDGKRLYATQPMEGRISVIETGCEPSVGCERVLDNLDVGDYPDQVVFHPSGDQAYVTHLARNIISVIE
jgi:hypothetical protein